jgi:hypothetical protein
MRPYSARKWILRLFGLTLAWLAANISLAGCGPAATQQTMSTTPGSQMILLQQEDVFKIYGEPGSAQDAQEVAGALQAFAPQIRRDLGLDYQYPVRVELFSSQDAFNRGGMNPEMQGYYAYSGSRRIQMVSPANPIPNLNIPYAQRAQIAAHEFAHLVNNAINPQMPVWLNEGVATVVGPHDVYTYTCQHAFPFGQIPPLSALEQDYSSVPGADLFAYAAVDFIVQTYGQETLNRLIRKPEAFEELLDPRRVFEQKWREYMQASYH